MVRSVTRDLPEQVKSNRAVNQAAGNGGQQMSQYLCFTVYTRTEVEIGKAMKKLMKGRTSFVIAHRLSTIRDADMILFMEKGNIIEQGNHKELLAKQGAYAKLYYSQFE